MTCAEGPSFICPECRRITYHPDDVAEGYCPHCKAFTRDLHESLAALDAELASGALTLKEHARERGLYRSVLKGRGGADRAARRGG